MKNFPKQGAIVRVETTETASIEMGDVENRDYFIRHILTNESEVLQSGISGDLVVCRVKNSNITFVIDKKELKEMYPLGKIYISGGISYNPEEALKTFNDAEIKLKALGYDVVSPFNLDTRRAKEMEQDFNSKGERTYTDKEVHKEYMRVCLDALLKEDVNKVGLVGYHWSTSVGAHREIETAKDYDYIFIDVNTMEEVNFGS